MSVLNGITVETGKTFDVPAAVTGRPYPEITWSKGLGGELSDRVFIKKTEDGVFLVVCGLVRCSHYFFVSRINYDY